MARRKLENVPDSGLDDYVDYHWDDIEAEAAKAGVGAEDLLFDDLVRRKLDHWGDLDYMYDLVSEVEDSGHALSYDLFRCEDWDE